MTGQTVGIADLAVYLPARTESAEQIAARSGVPIKVLEEKYGLCRKYVADAGEHASDLAVKAAGQIIGRADPRTIDVVIYCGSPHKDYPVWPCGPKIKHELGLDNAFAFEIMNMSAGFSTAIKVAKDMLMADPAINTILLAGGSRESDIVDPCNPRTRFMLNFADGGAALLLKKGLGKNLVLESSFYTDGSLYSHVRVPAGGSVRPASPETLLQQQHFVDIDDYQIMKNTLNEKSAANFIRVIKLALEKSGLAGSLPDYLALLQLKPDDFRSILEELGLDEEKSMYLGCYGHMCSLDIVISMHEGLRLGRIKPGSLVVAASAGTGYTWGATVISWG